MSSKIDLLNRALQLAAFGLGKVSPDPLLGWVLASAEQSILAEGWLPQKPLLSTLSFPDNALSNATLSKPNVLYANILPAITPDLIRVFSVFHISKICIAGNMGASAKQLVSKNISWEDTLLLENELFLNRRFYTYSERQRPYIMLKWAETTDGFIARKNYDSKWISNAQSRRLVHKWRTEEDAIMVGTNTAHYDNPKLNVRSWSGRNPTRIVIDKQLRLDRQLCLLDGSQPTLCYNLHMDQVQDNLSWVRIPESTDHLAFFILLLKDLWQRKVQSVMIEGGSQLLHFLIKHRLWDEARVFTSPQNFGEGIPAPTLEHPFLSESFEIDTDLLKIYQNTKS